MALSRSTFAQIAAALRATADRVEKCGEANDTNPRGAMAALGVLMVSLCDTCAYTADGIAGELRKEPLDVSVPPTMCKCEDCKLKWESRSTVCN